MKIPVVYICSFLFLIHALHAQATPDSIFTQANELYKEAKYEEALSLYLHIMEQGYESAFLYYNAGNAYFKTHNHPKAILMYERALLLDPFNENILFNLELANKYVADKIEKLPTFFIQNRLYSFISIFDSDSWAWLSIATFIIFLIVFALYLFSVQIKLKKISFWFSLLALTTSLFSYSFSYRQMKKRTSHDQAIIMTPMVVVRSAPDESGTELFVIHEGLKVTIKDNIGSWVEIRLADGNKGWINQDALERI